MNGYEKPVWLLVFIGLGAVGIITLFMLPLLSGQALAILPGDTPPTPDPLEIPELPENPTELELGRYSYYYNCMPCHGDKGQGLTDEWRQVWVEDHQNCWEWGCHGNLPEDLGFPLAEYIPPVMNTNGRLSRFDTAESLQAYLRATHPPQLPGSLPENDYRALTTLLLVENNRLPQNEQPHSAGKPLTAPPALGGVAVVVILAGLVFHTARHPYSQSNKPGKNDHRRPI